MGGQILRFWVGGGTLNDRSNLNFLVFLQNIMYFSFFIVSKNLHYTFR